MARRTFFSFHYDGDVWRAGVVRKSEVTKRDVPSEWVDKSLWESAKAQGRPALERLINAGLNGTSVTAVLIGPETSTRAWVQYEIRKSIERGNGLLGIYVHNIEDSSGRRARRGSNPLPSQYRTYDWINDDGYRNLGVWIEAAYKASGRR